MPINDFPAWVIVLGAFVKGGEELYDSIEEAIDDLVQDEEKKDEVRDKIDNVLDKTEKDPRTPFPSPPDDIT